MRKGIMMFDADEFLKILNSQEKLVEYEYRLYYDNEGFIFSGTTLKSDPLLENNYIVVDKDIFDRQSRYKIINGQLVEINRVTGNKLQLKKSVRGQRSIKNHSNLVLNDDEEFDEIEYYERRDN